MKLEYSLKISLTPHPHDNDAKPYYWSILAWEKEWHQIACGWEKDPEQCFISATKHFRSLQYE